MTYSIPLINRVTRPLALVLDALNDGKASTRDTEHL